MVLDMLHSAGSGHLGGSMSAAEIVSVLFFHQLRIDPKQPNWPDRDRFVASKGHCAPILYAALAKRGYFPESVLSTFRCLGSSLQGHPDMNKTPGVDMTAGSLGHGISVGIGMALGARLAKNDFRTYVLIGDGESDEGQIWEAAMAAVKFKLGNLTVICDFNRLQLDGPVEEVMPLEPLADKWRSFGWNVLEAEGHNVVALAEALDQATAAAAPTVILAHTVKGKGVSFAENCFEWHGKPVDAQHYSQACQELAKRMKDAK